MPEKKKDLTRRQFLGRGLSGVAGAATKGLPMGTGIITEALSGKGGLPQDLVRKYLLANAAEMARADELLYDALPLPPEYFPDFMEEHLPRRKSRRAKLPKHLRDLLARHETPHIVELRRKFESPAKSVEHSSKEYLSQIKKAMNLDGGEWQKVEDKLLKTTFDLEDKEIERLQEYERILRSSRDPSSPKSPPGWSSVPPPDTTDKPGTAYRAWDEIEKEVRDKLIEEEKITGRTLVTRSAGRGKTIPIGSTIPAWVHEQEALHSSKPAPKKIEGPKTERTTRPVEPERTTRPEEPERTTKPVESKKPLKPRITRTASPPVQLPSGKDLSRIALRGAATAAGWPLYAASFGIPTARSGESQVLAELADQPDADMDAALQEYRQMLAAEKEAGILRRAQENLGPMGMS